MTDERAPLWGPAAGCGAPCCRLPPAAADRTATVELQDVSRWYGNVVAVNDVSFALGPGITGLLGPNGAGKAPCPLLSGCSAVGGPGGIAASRRGGDPEVYRQSGLVPEREAVFPFLTGLDSPVQCPSPGAGGSRQAAARAIHTVDLTEAADRPIAIYSKGMRHRAKVAIRPRPRPARAAARRAFNGMDPRSGCT